MYRYIGVHVQIPHDPLAPKLLGDLSVADRNVVLLSWTGHRVRSGDRDGDVAVAAGLGSVRHAERRQQARCRAAADRDGRRRARRF